MTRLAIDQRYSAWCYFRWARACGYDRKTSYWYAVSRAGWREYRQAAYDRLPASMGGM